MSTIVDPGWPNVANVVASLGPDGKLIANSIEIMSKKRAILEDAPIIPTMFETSHLVSMRTGLPSPTWRGFNEGVDASKDTEVTFTETCGMLEDRAEVDVKLAKSTGDAGLFRYKKTKGKLEAFAQTLESAILYSSALTSPKQIHGLTPRYPATTGYTASGYVTKGTNAGSNCHSVWLISWDPDKCSLLYPKNSMAGFQHQDMGEQYVIAPNGKRMLAYVDQYNWDIGLMVGDYRYGARHQWDPDDAAYATSGKGLYLAINHLINTVYEVSPHSRLYMDRTSVDVLEAQLISNSQDPLKYLPLGGRIVPHFRGIPVRVTDGLVAEQAIN